MKSLGRQPITVVVPTLNAQHHLSTTVPSLLAAGRQYGAVFFVYVDNGSTDGSYEFLERIAAPDVRVVSRPDCTIAAARNYGAGLSSSTFLSFIDADCAIPKDYFERAVDVISRDGVSATGCEIDLPDAPHWIETAWHDLHYVGRERDVSYINSGNFFVLRSAFDAVGGFREDMRTGEDAELGARLNAAGHRIRASPRVRAIHLGNPKTLRQFYRRMVWHGLGVLGTSSWRTVDRPTAMLATHLALTGLGIALLFWLRAPLAARVGLFIALQLTVPAATVIYRSARARFTSRVVQGLLLYWLYYWARAQALSLVAFGRAGSYRK